MTSTKTAVNVEKKDRKRKSVSTPHSAQEKVQAVLAVWTERCKPAEVCRQLDINWITFNNGFHAAHHHDASEHWSLLPALHERAVAPRTDPRLIESSFAGYLARSLVWPARRVRYDGTPVTLAEPRPDRAFYRPRTTERAAARSSQMLADDVPPDSSPAR